MAEQKLVSFASNKNQRAVYPGSFDPLTFGHVDIVNRSLALFKNVTILIAQNRKKKSFLSIQERLDLTKEFFKDNPRVTIESWDGLLTDYMKQHQIHICIRGLRVLSDFENEFQMALTNNQLYPDFEVVFFMSNMQHANLSSSVVKEIIHFKGNIRLFVPELIAEYLEKRRNNEHN